MTGGGDTGDWQDSWVEALDTLELEVERAEALLRSAEAPEAAIGQRPWQPPDLGPLPDTLHARAVALLDRQLAAAEALTRAMLGARRHTELLGRLSGAEGDRRPVYVDRPL